MKVDELLQRHIARDTVGGDIDNVEDLGGYGLVRGARDRCFAVELRKKDDTILAVPYALVEQYLYSPAEGIVLRVAGREIKIQGKGLNDRTVNPLTFFSALNRQRVSWVQEQSRLNALDTESMVVIESIKW